MTRIAIITAGGAGMFCGSCMQDNTLARSLRLAGADAILVPTYTPIRVDEENVSAGRVFLGGINVYLDSAVPGWGRLPGVFKRWLDSPAVIRFLTRFSSSTDAAELGPLTIDLLQGTHGPQRAECRQLIDYLVDDLNPDVILFSNALLSGIVPDLKTRFRGTVLTILQGDDIFLEGLPQSHRRRAIDLVTENCRSFDGILTHSQFYSGFMSSYLSLPQRMFRQIPLCIDGERIPELRSEDESDERRLRIGYFARICPEKGADLFLKCMDRVLQQRTDCEAVIGGFLPGQHERWFHNCLSASQQRVGAERLRWLGSPADRTSKMELLSQLDLLFVPSPYCEPKGLYLLEAALMGVPALLPQHGAFPERIAELGEGMLFTPGDLNDAAAKALEFLEGSRLSVARKQTLRMTVVDHHNMETTGRQALQTIEAARLNPDRT
ncbi:MAG: glycosyltransferase family 4 protein [Planctomycetaceae bacterium]|nr:glycosyltransferase family 4 protein [Planctomycetaceae bacterium]